MKTKLRFLFVLLTMLWWGANFAWGDTHTYVLSGETKTDPTNSSLYTFSTNSRTLTIENASNKGYGTYSGTDYVKYSNGVQYTIAGVPNTEKITSVAFTGFPNGSTSDNCYIGEFNGSVYSFNSDTNDFNNATSNSTKTVTFSSLNILSGGFTFTPREVQLDFIITITTEDIPTYTTTISVADLCYGIGLTGKSDAELNRSVGGFDLSFTNGGSSQGVKYNGGSSLLLLGSTSGTMTVAMDENNSSLSMSQILLNIGTYSDASNQLTCSSGTLTKVSDTQLKWEGTASTVTFAHKSSDATGITISSLGITTLGTPSFSKITPTISLSSTSATITSHTAGTYTPTATMSPANFAWTWVGTTNSSAGVTYAQGNANGGAIGDPGTFTTTASSTPGTNTMTASFTAGENPWFNDGTSATYTLTINPNYSGFDNTIQTYPYTWDFNYSSSSWGNTATQLAGYDDWNYNGGYYWNRTNPNNSGYTEPIKYNVDVLKGLELSLSTYIGLDWDYTSGDGNHYGHIWMGGSSFIQIPDLSEGQTVTFVMEGREGSDQNGNARATSVTLTNATGETTSISRSDDNHQTYVYTVIDDGSAKFLFDGAVSIRSIAVGANPRSNVTFDYIDANGKLLTQIDKPVQGNEVTHIFGANNTIRLTASCADANYNTVEFEKGKNRSSVKWDQNAYLTLSSDRAVIKKVVFTLKSSKSEAANIGLATGSNGTGSANTTDGTYTWTGTSSFVKFIASGGNVNNLASIYVEYVERTALTRFSPMGRQTTTWEYETGNPVATQTIIVNPNTTDLSAQTTDFEVAFTSNREVIAATVGTNPTIDGTNKERVHFNTGVTRGKPGTADVYYRYKGNGTYSGAMSVVTYTITKATQTLSFANNNEAQDQSFSYGTFTHTATSNVSGATIKYKSSDTHVAKVDNNGVVTFENSGVTTITATTDETDYYTGATASYQLTVNGSDNYSGTINWDTSENFAVPSNIDYGQVDYVLATTTVSGKTVKYRSSDESIATVSVETHSGQANACKITPVGKGTIQVIAYIEGQGEYNPLESRTSDITIHGTTFGVQFRSAKGKVTVGKTLTPYVKVPNGRLEDFTSITVTTGNASIATVSAGQSTTYNSEVTLYDKINNKSDGISELGGDLKAIYPTIYGNAVGTTTITLTLESSKYETTTIQYQVEVVSDNQHFNWAKIGNNADPIMAYTIFTGDYMMVPAISGNANGNWDYSKGDICETKEAYLYGMRAGSPIWNYADFKVGGGYPNYRLTESSTLFSNDQKASMTNQTDKAYIVWAASQNTSNDTLMIYANKPGTVYLHAFDAQTGSELTPITITILDKSTLAENMENYVTSMTYPYTWDFTKDITVTATPNYWEPHYNSSGTLDYYICGYSTMFNWDYCDQDNNGNMNEALGNVEISSPSNKFFIGANSDTGMDGIMPQFYGLTIYSGNSGDTRTKSYESKTDKLRYDHDAGEGNAHLHVVGGVHYLRLPNPSNLSNFIEGENNFKLIIKAKPTGGKCTLYKFKNGDHGTSGSGTATWEEIKGETPSIVMFDVEASEMTGDNYVELGVDNVNIYWISMSTEAKAINPASGATGNNIEMMATYSYEKAMDYYKSAEANGIDAYVATNLEWNTSAKNLTVTLTKANTQVPTMTGVVLRSQKKASESLMSFESGSNNKKSNNELSENDVFGDGTIGNIYVGANKNGWTKIESFSNSVSVDGVSYKKCLNLMGISDTGRRYIRFELSGASTIKIACQAPNATGTLKVLAGNYDNLYLDDDHSYTVLGTVEAKANAASGVVEYTGNGEKIWIYSETNVPIYVYGVTIADKGKTAYMIADAQNEQGYNIPDAPSNNYLKATGNATSMTLYRNAGNEDGTTSGDTHIPFIFSSVYARTATGNQAHEAGYFAFWRIWYESITAGKQMAYLVLDKATYGGAAENNGKASDITNAIATENGSRMGIRFVDGDESPGELTSIESVERQGIKEPEHFANDSYYNLNGMRVERPSKGLYIHNGKKVWVK